MLWMKGERRRERRTREPNAAILIIDFAGDREHNLKNVDWRSRRRQDWWCFNGLSGYGKSSLAFDTTMPGPAELR